MGLDDIVLGLAQNLIPLGVPQPWVNLIGGGLQQRQSPLSRFGSPMLSVPDDLVIDFFLATTIIMATILSIIITAIQLVGSTNLTGWPC